MQSKENLIFAELISGSNEDWEANEHTHFQLNLEKNIKKVMFRKTSIFNSKIRKTVTI